MMLKFYVTHVYYLILLHLNLYMQSLICPKLLNCHICTVFRRGHFNPHTCVFSAQSYEEDESAKMQRWRSDNSMSAKWAIEVSLLLHHIVAI